MSNRVHTCVCEHAWVQKVYPSNNLLGGGVPSEHEADMEETQARTPTGPPMCESPRRTTGEATAPPSWKKLRRAPDMRSAATEQKPQGMQWRARRPSQQPPGTLNITLNKKAKSKCITWRLFMCYMGIFRSLGNCSAENRECKCGSCLVNKRPCTWCGRPLSCSMNGVNSRHSSKPCAVNVLLLKDILRFGQAWMFCCSGRWCVTGKAKQNDLQARSVTIAD